MTTLAVIAKAPVPGRVKTRLTPPCTPAQAARLRTEMSENLRRRGGPDKLLITDGPFAETKEVIVGFDVLECADLDEAIEIARRHPMAFGGRIELRAFAPLA